VVDRLFMNFPKSPLHARSTRGSGRFSASAIRAKLDTSGERFLGKSDRLPALSTMDSTISGASKARRIKRRPRSER